MAKKVEVLTMDDIRAARNLVADAWANRIAQKPLHEQIAEINAIRENPLKWYREQIQERLERILAKHVQSAPVRKKILFEMFGE